MNGEKNRVDLDTKKELAKVGMSTSLALTVATAFFMKNRSAKRLHVVAGTALVGFSFWHHMLYQPREKDGASQGRRRKSKAQKSQGISE